MDTHLKWIFDHSFDKNFNDEYNESGKRNDKLTPLIKTNAGAKDKCRTTLDKVLSLYTFPF